MNSFEFQYFFLFLSFIGTNGQSNDVIEHCIDSKFHKKQPAKEDNLHKQCKPWQKYSCCSEGTTITTHGTPNHYHFNYDVCPGRVMSQQCKKHFIQDLCFYECEPYLKPWVQKVNRSFARERIFKVPICASDCELWWSECKDDFTCAFNWARDFKWINKTNTCPKDSTCQPISSIYKNGTEFCENVWDHSWQYTTEDKPCMRIWFNGSLGNPNRETALYYYSLAVNRAQNLVNTCSLFSSLIVLSVIKSINFRFL